MQTITPCLWFDGNAEEAANFYVTVFPNSAINRITRTPASGTPGNAPGSVILVEFTLDGQDFVGLNGGPTFSFSEAISFQIYVADQAENDRYWAALTAGGQESACGWLKDRYGLSWQVVPTRFMELIADPDPDRAQRAFSAMMTMGRIDIAAVESAVTG